MYERFTDRARKVMQLANQEAQRFNHEYLGTEHILLGLVKEASGVAACVLTNLGVDLRRCQLEVEKIAHFGPDVITRGKLPHTPRAQNVIEYAIDEACALGHNYIGTEHLLLGLLREVEGVAAQVLMNLGLNLGRVRDEVVTLLGTEIDYRFAGGVSGARTKWYPFPLTEGARRVLRATRAQVQVLDHGVISTGHFLLGLLAYEEGRVSKILRAHGASFEAARAELLRRLDEPASWPGAEKALMSDRLGSAIERAQKCAQHVDSDLPGKLDQLQTAKEEAVAAMDFEQAAVLRDEADRIRKELRLRRWRVTPEDFCLALFDDPDCLAARILSSLGIEIDGLRAKIERE